MASALSILRYSQGPSFIMKSIVFSNQPGWASRDLYLGTILAYIKLLANLINRLGWVQPVFFLVDRVHHTVALVLMFLVGVIVASDVDLAEFLLLDFYFRVAFFGVALCRLCLGVQGLG